jgi:hypothetical protein
VLLKVFSDWLKVITTLYPKLFDPRTDAEALLRRPTADQVGLIRDHGYPLVLALFEYMRGGELVVPAVAPTEPEPEIATEPVITTEPATDPVEEEEDDEAEEATREEEPEVTEAEEVSRPEENQLRETEPFAVRVNSRLTDAESNNVGPDGITVTRLVISDERPDTRFRGGKQMSHTIPWTLARIAWARALSGKTIQAVAQALRARIATEKGWSADSTLDWVTEERDELDAALAEVDTYAMSIPEWTAWLGATVERYVEAYQASPFAAYATEATSSGESTARGRGESAAMKTLAGWDKDVKEGRPPPSEASAKAYGAKLIDVPELSSNRALVDTDKLKTRWIEDLAAAFPDLVGVRRAAFEAAFDDEAVQSAHAMELDANASQPTGVNLRKRKVVYS